MLLDCLTNEFKQLMKQGDECVKQKKTQQALLYFTQAVLLVPDNIDVLISCAKTLIELNRPTEAAVYSKRALQLKVTQTTLTMHGQVLYRIGEFNKALDCFDHIIAKAPNNYIALGRRALCLTQINRHEEALLAYRKALNLCQHKDDLIQYNYSLCLLATGNLLLGFSLFEYRWRCSLLAKNHTWILPEIIDGETLRGKSFLISSEQGLGDNIQFFRYIPFLITLGARIFFETSAALIPLFSAWHKTINFIALGSPLPHCDYHCPLMSLARLFKTELHSIPQMHPYVSPDLTYVETCQKKLQHLNKKRIGIAWRGSDLNPMNAQRSIALSELLTIYQSNFDFICLQKDIYVEEKKFLDQYKIPYYGLELSTMTGTAALIACLDLVITVDTSIAHLAAAMNKHVWILLPVSADWRWFLQREDSPWYPNVTLFRQTALKDWSTPLECIKQKLLTRLLETETTVEDLMMQADLQFQKGLLSQAEQLYRDILVKNPTNHRALHSLALIAFQQNNMVNAIQFFHQSIEMGPDIALYRRNLGELLRRVGQEEAAIASHKMAISIEPHSAENHYLLALAYNKQQLELSIQHYRIALSYDQNYGMAWNNLGASLERLGDKEQAKMAYSTAIQINSNHVEAQNNLGAIYSEEGKLEEARSHFEAAIANKPDFIDAHYNLSLIKTYSPDDPHLACIESLMHQIEHYPVPVRIRYYFALGKALDDVQQYARAFEAYAQGNRLYSLLKPWNKARLKDVIQQLPSIFPQFLRPTSTKTKETRYPIFVVGMPRSGTTLIEQILASHASIYGAGELSILDEVIQEACHAANMSFATWVTQLSDPDFARLGQCYLERVWKLAPDKNFIIDKMPSNWFYLGMIYRMLPTAKIIHAIRDPMDSCFSCFTHLFNDEMTFSYDLTTLGNYYLLYAQTMQHWFSVIPSEAIFDVSYEKLVANPELVSKQLVDYIGLPWDANCLQFHKNNRIVKTASLTQVRKPIYKTSLKRWEHFTEELQPLLSIVAPYRNLKRISI